MRYAIPTICIRCGISEISAFFDDKEGRIFVCWYCGHRTTAEYPQSVQCIHCKSTEATEFYDEQDGVVIECPDCGHYEISGQRSVEYPRVVECSQCGNSQAGEFDVDGSFISCLKCGREERKSPICDTEGNVCGWKHAVRFGAGCLHFKKKGEGTESWTPLHTTEEAIECEKVTRERLRNGEYVEEETYLTRWDSKTRQAITILGHFTLESWLEGM